MCMIVVNAETVIQGLTSRSFKGSKRHDVNIHNKKV